MRARLYLSHSQKKLWNKSKEDYILKYVYEKKQFVTKEMKFGTLVADLLENGGLSGDLMLDVALAKMPKFELMDKEQRCEMKIGKSVVPLLVKMDTSKIDFTAFKEYKTGKEGKGGWTQKKVDDDEQITFYATWCYIKTGKIPEDIELVWVKTKDDETDIKKIKVTGEVEIFKTSRSKMQIIKEKADMLKVWNEIGIACEEELL